jgi:hypothetical protein
MPNHYVGDLLHTMGISGLSHVRTELFQLLVVPFLAPHPVHANRQFPRHRHLGDRPSSPRFSQLGTQIIFGSFLPSLLVGLHLQSLLGPGSRHCYGIISTFDAASIKLFGTIAGIYSDKTTGASDGFGRAPNGTYKEFEVSGAGTAAGQGTFPNNINLEGSATGDYVNSTGVSYGFVRTPGGSITKFNAAGTGLTAGQGTFPTANDPEGGVTGYFLDENNIFHGFVVTP